MSALFTALAVFLHSLSTGFPVFLAKGSHSIPFRTRPLSPSAPMVALRGKSRSMLGTLYLKKTPEEGVFLFDFLCTRDMLNGMYTIKIL